MRVIVDTSAFIALFIQTDQNHRRARDFFRGKSLELFTNSVIVAEVYTHLRYRHGFQTAIAARQFIADHPILRTAYWEAIEDAQTYDMLTRLRGISLSYADASLLVLAERIGIREIVSFDSDFRLAAFTVLPD